MPGWGRMAHMSGMEHSTGKGLEARDGSQELRVLVQRAQQEVEQMGVICVSDLFLGLGIASPRKQHYRGQFGSKPPHHDGLTTV